VVALEAHHTEREDDMLDLTLGALRRAGAPAALYLDNGSTYCGEVLRLACERLGITLIHAQPYDAPARGKMERFWRTLREGCLDHFGTLTSLHDVQARLLLTARLHERNDGLGAAGELLAAATPDLVDGLSKLLGELGVSAPRGLRGDLQRDGVKADIVAFRVALDQSLDVIRARHVAAALTLVPR
jgi:hypothetical protein